MPRKRLRNTAISVIGSYVAAVVFGVWIHFKYHSLYEVYKDLIPFLIAIPATFLAYAIQRRTSYLSALREFWAELIPVVQAAVQYTHIPTPTQSDFASTMKQLSTVTDFLRGVFKNVPSSDSVGLYPYENLKDIQSVVAWLGYEKNRTEHDRYWARRCITTLWASMHQAMLLEFDREIPVYPVSKYLNGKKSIADKLLTGGQLDEEDLKFEMKEQRERLLNAGRERFFDRLF